MKQLPEAGDLVVANVEAVEKGDIDVTFLHDQSSWSADSTTAVFWLGQATDATVWGKRWVILFPNGRIGMTGIRDSWRWRVISKYKEAYDELAKESCSCEACGERWKRASSRSAR